MPVPAHHLAALAASPGMPVAGMRALAASRPDKAVAAGQATEARRVLATRADVPADLMTELAFDPDATTRRNAIARVSDPAVLEDLATRGTPTIEAGLAANPMTPASLLNRFAETGDLSLPSSPARSALANPGTSSEIVVRRVSAESGEVLGSAAEVSRTVMAGKILDAHPAVAHVWAQSYISAAVRAVARRTDIDPDRAQRLYAQRASRVRPVLEMNPFIPDDALGVVSKRRARLLAILEGTDPHDAVRNPSTRTQLAALGSATLDRLILDTLTLDTPNLDTPNPGTPSLPSMRDTQREAREVAEDGAQEFTELDRLVLQMCWRTRPHIEVDVAAGLIAGLAAGRGISRVAGIVEPMGTTRLKAIGAEVPLVGVLAASKAPHKPLPTTAEIAETFTALGDRPELWETFGLLIARERSSVNELALVAAAIHHDARASS